jgi:hypothetical protein
VYWMAGMNGDQVASRRSLITQGDRQIEAAKPLKPASNYLSRTMYVALLEELLRGGPVDLYYFMLYYICKFVVQ